MYIEDQALRGVYKTTRKDKKEKDVLTGSEKTVTYVELAPGSLDVIGKPITNNEWITNIIATLSF
jgi:hypothetical protein